MKGKKIFILCIVIFGLMISTFENQIIKAEEEELDLLILAKKIKDENIVINGWSLHAREKLESLQSHEAVNDYIDSLRKKFSTWDWQTNVSGKHSETSFVLAQKEKLESITILSTLTNDKPQTYIIYEVKGKKLDKENISFLKNGLDSKLSKIFHGKATIFSCIKGEFNDNMDTSLSKYVKRIMKALHAKEIEALEEDSFISTSAYSPLFNQSISTNKIEMNLQMGLRNEGLGAKTTVVIGTPIITIEY